MTFTKPKNVTYTDMAIYIDENVYNEKFNENLIFEYIYHLIYMLAYKERYFNRASYYDDFALHGATRIYFRLTNKKQFEFKPDGSPKMKRVKSVLNYIKTTLYPMKVTFEQETYSQGETISSDNLTDETLYSYAIQDTVDEIQIVNFNMCLGDICKTIKAYVRTLPYASDPVMLNNLYLSCLLSFLNKITLSNSNKDKLMKKGMKAFDDLYEEESKSPVILFHLDESMRSYVTVLVNVIKHMIAKDLSELIQVRMPQSANTRNLTLQSCDKGE